MPQVRGACEHHHQGRDQRHPAHLRLLLLHLRAVAGLLPGAVLYGRLEASHSLLPQLWRHPRHLQGNIKHVDTWNTLSCCRCVTNHGVYFKTFLLVLSPNFGIISSFGHRSTQDISSKTDCLISTSVGLNKELAIRKRLCIQSSYVINR